MFRFDFHLEGEDEENPSSPGPSRPRPPSPAQNEHSENIEPCYHVYLSNLLDSLPETITYSPLPLPYLPHPILRRDLHDARFQLAEASAHTPCAREMQQNGEGEGEGEADRYVDTETDLISGVYEGGLKTWEGGLDLVEVLAGMGERGGDMEGEGIAGEWIRGSKVLEVGCGTALPTAYLLHSLLSGPTSSEQGQKTILHLQDFNLPVLRLVTLPNLLLATVPFLSADVLKPPPDAEDDDTEPSESAPIDPDSDGDDGILHLTSKVKTAFLDLLQSHGIQLRFTYGHWSGFASDLEEEIKGKRKGKGKGEEEERGYGLVLTSETIYSEGSVGSLIRVLKAATAPSKSEVNTKEKGDSELPEQGAVGKEDGIEEGIQGLRIEGWRKTALRDQREGVILVAAKVLYFGVGGGLQQFLRLVEGQGGWWEVVKEWTRGVGRRVVRIGW